MRPLRSPRKSARLVTVAAASCATAMLALTGCGGDDDKGGPAIPPPSMPAMPSLKPMTLPPLTIETGGSSKSPTGGSAAGAPTAPKPTGSSKAEAREKYEVGDCVNSFTKDVLTKVPCSVVHLGEVAAVYTLPDSTNPSSATYEKDISDKCKELLLPILDRQPNKDELAYTSRGPTATSWANENDRTLECLMTGKGGKKLNAPLAK